MGSPNISTSNQARAAVSAASGDTEKLDKLLASLPDVLGNIVKTGTNRERDNSAKTLIALKKAVDSDRDSRLPRSTSFQKEIIESLSQQATAHLLGITSRHIRDHRTPRKDDGTYSGPEAVQWFVEKKIKEARQKWEAESDEYRTAKERQAEAKAIKLEEEAKGVQGTYVSRAEAGQKMAAALSAIRTTFESLPKAMAASIPEDIREMFIQDLQNEVRQRLRTAAQMISEL